TMPGSLLRIPDLAGFVDLWAGKADICRSGSVILRNPAELIAAITAVLCHFAPRLCRVVFVGLPALRRRLDIKRVGLRAEDHLRAAGCSPGNASEFEKHRAHSRIA